MKKITPSYIYSVIGTALVLFLLGSMGWLMLNGNGLNKFLKENIEVQVILNDNTRDEKADQLVSILDQQPFVQSLKKVTKEEAMEEFSKQNQEDFMELLDFNPLFTSINLNLHSEYVNQDSMAKIKEFLLQSNIVREVSYPKPIVNKLDNTLKKISLALGAVSLILFVSVIFLIDNTVRLAMFSNRHIIKTMQMVGATRWFIAKPFDMQSILSGLISGVIACLAIVGLRSVALQKIPELYAFNDDKLFYLLLVVIVIIGILISLLSTHRSVYKYLKLKVEDLY